MKLNRPIKIILIGMMVGLALAAAYTFFQPRLYAATARVLVTQTAASGLDPYTAIKTSERVGASLSQLINTSTFMKTALARAQGFSEYDFFYRPKTDAPADDAGRLAIWNAAVSAKTVTDTGILKITVFHPACDQAKILAGAVAQQLVDQAPGYFGPGVRAQLVDEPLCSSGPVKPNFLKNLAAGALFGLLFSGILLLSKPRSGA